MAMLRAIAPRIHLGSDPYVNRYPVYNPDVLYQTGSVVSRPFGDSDQTLYYNFYVAQDDIPPGSADPEHNQDGWLLWVSGDPALQALYTDSEIHDYVIAAQDEYTQDFLQIDSDFQRLDSDVQALLTYQAQLDELRAKIEDLESRKVIYGIHDSDLINMTVPVWNQTRNQFEAKYPVLSVNNIYPDNLGNVSYELAQTRTGTRDDRADSEVNGTLFIVIGDSDSQHDGTTYAFADGWVRVIGYTEQENDNRYVNLSGDTMTGPLKMAAHPVADSEVATKGFVDSFNDADKQDKIVFLDSEADLLAYSYTLDEIYFVKTTAELWTYNGFGLQKFVIPAERIWDPVFVEANVTTFGVTAGYFDVTVQTYRFSDQLEGALRIYKEGSLNNTPFSVRNNISGNLTLTFIMQNVKLVNSNTQVFQIRVGSNYVSTDKWVLEFRSHDGAVTSIILEGETNPVAYSDSNRIFNFGEY